MEKLMINKENYEGYTELYRARRFFSKKSREHYEKIGKKIAIFFGVTAPIGLLAMISVAVLGLTGVVKLLSFMTFMAPWIIAPIVAWYTQNRLIKKQIAEVKEKYEYVDTDIKTEELEKSLEKANILKYKYGDRLDIEGYKDYLKAEEVKEKYFEETRYDGYRVNPEITQEELEKPKVKKLVR